MQLLLLLSYPLLTHVGVMFEQQVLLPIAIVLLAAAIFFSSLKALQWKAWSILTAVACVAAVLHTFHSAIFVMYIPPIVVPSLLAWGFLRTLFAGRTPLVTEIGEKARGPLSKDMQAYTRGVTIMWAVCLSAIASWGVLLAFFGNEMLWSSVTNIVNQLLVGTLFIGEFIVRKLRFQDHDHPTFTDYIKIVFRSQRGSAK